MALLGSPSTSAVASASAAPTQSGSSTDLSNSCGGASWTAGVTNVCDGTVVYRDYVYDDYGANTHTVASNTCPAPNPATLPTGDQRYPAGEEDTTDLRELRMRVDKDRLVVTFTLNALFDADSTIAALAVDSDNDSTTGGGAWPGLHISSRGWDTEATFRAGDPGVTVDTANNTITGTLPRPAGTSWRLQAVTAQADGTVMNVGFRGPGEMGPWFEDHQAAALAAGDVTDFGHTVRVADLTTNATKVAAVGPGLHQRVYRSAYTLGPGEGMSYEGIPGNKGDSVVGQKFHFFGAFQPYAVYVPDKPGPHGVQLVLHGACDPLTFMLGKPGAQQQLGEARNRVLVTPLGRGPIGWYAGPAERDVLDALDDAEAAYDIDASRVFVSGYSMGGYGSLRFATLYPDRFAGFLDWVGYTDCLNGVPFVGDCPAVYGANFNPTNYVRNLRWVPGGMLYAGADELVHATSAVALQQAMAATGYPYTWWMHPAAEHGTLAILDDWRKESVYSAPWTRQANPPRVTYRFDPSLDEPEYGLVHDHAYWVSRLRTAGAGAGQADLTSQGCGGSLPLTQPTTGEGTDPVPWVSQGAAVTGSTPLLQAKRLTGTLTNVASANVDADATCLRNGGISYDITTDAPTTIRFSDGRTLQLASAGRHIGQIK
jgi:dienelactone hydrolase